MTRVIIEGHDVLSLPPMAVGKTGIFVMAIWGLIEMNANLIWAGDYPQLPRCPFMRSE